MPKKIPVYSIEHFRKGTFASQFYCNNFNTHVKNHQFTNLPHKHDFYLSIIITKGHGWHEIDFVKYKVKPGAVFLMQPAQMHYWKLSPHIDGFVFFHTAEFYNQSNALYPIQELSFFKSFNAIPYLKVSKQKLALLQLRIKEIAAEYHRPSKYATEKMNALLKLLYLELAEDYSEKQLTHSQSYAHILSKFEAHIENNFKQHKSAGYYAKQLAVSTKHLNRITQTCLAKTATELITERVLLEAKRLLLLGTGNVNEISSILGFENASYFIRLFKKNVSLTPRAFIQQQTK